MTIRQLFLFSCFVFGSIGISAQGLSYPNELPDYQFFKSGKLSQLTFGVSKAEDVARVFGGDCRKICDYDETWKVRVMYFHKAISHSKLTKGKLIQLELKPQFVGTISRIILEPKVAVSFADKKFDERFRVVTGTAGSSIPPTKENPQGGLKKITLNSFRDEFGLSYRVITGIMVLPEGTAVTERVGDLSKIEYSMRDADWRNVWTEEK